ncbi:hypothetical protein M8J77_002061 [Diaphorina citri]|nr:hypothetical protein M8J77_002061 [Diaphorina citri]
MQVRGIGVSLFKEVKSHNKYLTASEGLSNREVTEMIKMNTNTVAIRGIPGRSHDGVKCRRCPQNIENKPTESLAHVLGNCQYGQLLRINRHNSIRSIIADELRKNVNYEVHEEVTSTADNGSTRRIDIIVIDKKTKNGVIFDPTIRFETNCNQPHEVNEEKRNIYLPTVSFYKEKYKLIDIEVMGLLIGARGTITTFFKDFCIKFSIKEDTIKKIVQTTVRGSIGIIRNHIYGPN